MSIYVGSIVVPTSASSGTFPIKPDFGSGAARNPKVAVHRFGSDDAKIEQRFVLGNGAKTFTVTKKTLSLAEKNALQTFFITNQGIVGNFTYNAPNQDGTTTAYTCRFQSTTLTVDSIVGAITSSAGLVLQEVPSATPPAYSISATVTRFPSSGLATSLLNQVNTCIPLITIKNFFNSSYPLITLSDRNVTVGGVTYAARLTGWSGISQRIDGSADDVKFQFGNADRVMYQLVNACNLDRASVQFCIFHVESCTLIQLWAGNVISPGGWSADAGPNFTLNCSDPANALNLVFPTREVTRQCWKSYNDGLNCPWAAQSNAVYSSRTFDVYGVSTTYTFTPDATKCDKGWVTPNGCVAHGMNSYFGGVQVNPQGVVTKDNSTGFIGIGRKSLTSVSQINDTAWGNTLPYVFCAITAMDANGQPSIGFPITAQILSGRDEGDFYAALAAVCQGPIVGYASQTSSVAPHQLDDSPPFGWPKTSAGLRMSIGDDPAQDYDGGQYGIFGASNEFSLSQVGPGGPDGGPDDFDIIQAAGLAFCEIRRTDPKGLQLSLISDHQMVVSVRSGFRCYTWAAPGSRNTLYDAGSDPFWICANIWLIVNNAYHGSDTLQESLLDIPSLIAASAISSAQVPTLFGTGNETQFQFCGIAQDLKGVRDWFRQILQNALGYFTFSFGKLRVGIRVNASAVEAFNSSNIIFNSLSLTNKAPRFNWLTASFADIDYQFQQNTLTDYDIDHATAVGSAGQPVYYKSQINLNGTPTASQAARIVTTMLREELGGAGVNKVAEWEAARSGSFQTTILALNTEAGQVISIGNNDTMTDLPNFPGTDPANPTPTAAQPYYVEARISGWTLNPDWSITIAFDTVNADMYTLDVGPKPADVPAPPVPEYDLYPPEGFLFQTICPDDGTVTLENFAVGNYGDTVHQGIFQIFYIDETIAQWCGSTAPLTTSNTTFNLHTLFGQLPQVGTMLQIGEEIMLVIAITPAGSVTVARGQLGTTPAATAAPTAVVSTLNSANPASCLVGTGLGIIPGSLLVPVTAGSGTQPGAGFGYCVSYSNTTGVLVSTVPLHIGVGSSIAVTPLLSFVSLKQFTVPFAPRFFSSGGRAFFSFSVPLPSAGIVAIQGLVEDTRGVQSAYTTYNFTASGYPFRLRTGSGNVLKASHPSLPNGPTLNAFANLQVPASQSFQSVYAQISGTGLPIAPPRAPSSVTLAGTAAQVTSGIPPGSSGTITFGGTVDATAYVYLYVLGEYVDMQLPVWSAQDSGITSSSTLAQVAASFAAWVNQDPQFGTYFIASSSSAVVTLTDKQGLVAHMQVATSGNLTCTFTTLFSNLLNVVTGRQYAIAYADTGAGYVTELSQLSPSSGPTAAYGSIVLGDIPLSTDSRVNQINIYAYPDGNPTGAPRLVGTIANSGGSGGSTMFTDNTTESALAANSLYPGVNQPTNSGNIFITIYKDGQTWLTLFIAASASRSQVVDGIPLYGIGTGAIITADVVNNGGVGELDIIFA